MKTNNNYKVAFLSHKQAPFIEADKLLLEKHFKVTSSKWTRTLDVRNVLNILKSVYEADIMFIWFAGSYAFLPILAAKLLAKKTLSVVGGYEVACEPSYDYGAMCKSISRQKTLFVIRNCQKLLAVSNFTKAEIYATTNLKDNVYTIYNGVDTTFFKPGGEKDKSVVTVGSKIEIKGIDTFINVAKMLDSITFKIIGLEEKQISELAPFIPSNIELFGHLSPNELLYHYQKARVYCQLSYRESFGVALVEAMACECTPVVTKSGALPEVVGNTGFCVEFKHPEETAKAIEAALNSDKGIAARERVHECFSIELREKKLISILNDH